MIDLIFQVLLLGAVGVFAVAAVALNEGEHRRRRRDGR